ncbi:hypothetical protein [Bacillus thuringiensis]|uniref:hypothetical protein n=1 Tax=Bacillus thuringiensis TaxID=1428 RepID=UPI000BEDDE8C|nr:hypothetical protein [Bacillus thuringiensis]PEE69356.1 hypothetical protein COM73_18905 [Bacillus thuringiensis]
MKSLDNVTVKEALESLYKFVERRIEHNERRIDALKELNLSEFGRNSLARREGAINSYEVLLIKIKGEIRKYESTTNRG